MPVAPVVPAPPTTLPDGPAGFAPPSATQRRSEPHLHAHHGRSPATRNHSITLPRSSDLASLPPAHTRTVLWRGERSEWNVASVLNLGLGRPVFVLDRRRSPADGKVLDHVIVAQTGAWVVTVKHSQGLVEEREIGSFGERRSRLVVGGRERTRALRSAHERAAAVADLMAQMGEGWRRVPVHPVLCFVDADWRPLARPFEVDGVTVTWPKQLGSLVFADAVIAPRSVDALANHLDGRLPPASPRTEG